MIDYQQSKSVVSRELLRYGNYDPNHHQYKEHIISSNDLSLNNQIFPGFCRGMNNNMDYSFLSYSSMHLANATTLDKQY